jgi:hypothetical protein
VSGPAPGARALFARYEAPQAVVGWRGEAHGRGYRAATNDEPRQAEITACTPDCTTSTAPRMITIIAFCRVRNAFIRTRVADSPSISLSRAKCPRETPARTCIRKCRRVPRAVSTARPTPRARSAQRARMTGPSLTTIVPRRERFAREYRLLDRHRLVRCAKAHRTEGMRGAIVSSRFATCDLKQRTSTDAPEEASKAHWLRQARSAAPKLAAGYSSRRAVDERRYTSRC